MKKIKFLLLKSKYSILIVLGLMISNLSYGQDYYHGVGFQYDYGVFKIEASSDVDEFSETSTPGVPGIFYKATLAFSDNFAISAYPFIGFSGSANSRTGASDDFALGIQLPVVAEYYMGDIDDSCFFVGAGFSYASIGSVGYGSGKAFGPQLSIGGQFELRQRLIGLRLAATLGLNSSDSISGLEFTKDTHNVFSLGVYYVL